ncbi:MAG: VWA domain-containing protein [Chromatocurvus sp.]
MTDFLSSVHLLRPHWLWLLVPLAALVWWLARRGEAGGSWHSVIAPELLPYLMETTPARRRRRLLPIVALAWLTAVVAIAGPSWKKLPQPVLQKQDALVLVLDLSYSMWAQDTRPSRIDRARRKLLDLLDRRREGQTALVAFAGDAHVVTPLTDDHPTIANLLPALDPGMMPLPGSDPVSAVAAAQDLLASAGVVGGHVLLVTDGVDSTEGEAIRSLLDAGGARLSVLGVGTPEGAPIPLPDGGFLKDGGGAIVMPTRPTATLRDLASDAGGRYLSMTVDASDLDALLAQADDGGNADTREIDRRTDTWADMAHWFALPLLPLLLLAFRRGAVYAALPLLVLLPSEHSRADGWRDLWLTPDQQGARALSADDAEAAAGHFSDPRWRGTAAYEADDYAAAVDDFTADDSADGWYNRGNALARQGELDAAIAAYRESLQRDPGREDAADNLELVEQLRRQQEQQQDQSQDQKQDQDQRQNSEGTDQQQNDGSSEQNESAQSPGEQSPDQQSSQQSDQQSGQQSGDGDPAQAQESEEPSSEQEQDATPTSGNDKPETEGGQAGAAESREQPEASIDTASSLAESLERDQAMQQWLRRVPDDPAGLLREKFRYESRKRQRRGDNRSNDEEVW